MTSVFVLSISIPLVFTVLLKIIYLIKNPFFLETHHTMTKESCDTYEKGTFDDFLRCYNARVWERDINFPSSHFEADIDYPYYNSQIHASIICFDKVGMLLDRKSYKKFKKWEKENTLSCNKEVNNKIWN